MPFLHERLENGLDVIAEISAGSLSTSVGFFVRTGARDETDDVWGVSHFLEHMVFKGTPDLSADDINQAFDRLGATANAFTSEEDTVYYATVLPEHQDDVVELLARMMRPALRTQDFDTEKLVILEEIRMYDDQPPFGADDRCRAAFFGRHPLARSVLGTVASIQALPVESMRDYHRRRYAPGTMVLAASGAVDFPALVAAARRLCGGWPAESGDRHAAAAAGQSPGLPTAAERIVRPSAALEYVVRMSAGPGEKHGDRFAAKLLAVILGDGSGSRLYWALVDPGLAEQASCHHHDFLDAGVFTTQLSCDTADAEPLLARIVEMYATATAEGISPQEFARARNKLASRVVLSGERPRRRLFDIGLEWSHSATYRTVRDNLRIVESLTLDDVHRVLAAWPLAGPAATVLAGPGGEAASDETGGEA
jgi:predicted Zn-dependent peptidase